MAISGGIVSGITYETFVHGEMPTQTPNGSITNFDTDNTYKAGTLQVYLNGVRLTKDEHFTEDGDLRGFNFTTAPLSGFRIEQDYLK